LSHIEPVKGFKKRNEVNAALGTGGGDGQLAAYPVKRAYRPQMAVARMVQYLKGHKLVYSPSRIRSAQKAVFGGGISGPEVTWRSARET
jgi:hypothetical protein